MTTIHNYELSDGVIMTRFEFCKRTQTVTVRHCDVRPGPGSGQFACYQGRSLDFGRRTWKLALDRGAKLTKETVTTW